MLSLCTGLIASSLLEGSLELLFLMKSSVTFYLACISVMSSNFPTFNWIFFSLYRKKCQGARLGMKWDGVHGHVCGKKKTAEWANPFGLERYVAETNQSCGSHLFVSGHSLFKDLGHN